jgi:hypothetical protein
MGENRMRNADGHFSSRDAGLRRLGSPSQPAGVELNKAKGETVNTNARPRWAPTEVGRWIENGNCEWVEVATYLDATVRTSDKHEWHNEQAVLMTYDADPKSEIYTDAQREDGLKFNASGYLIDTERWEYPHTFALKEIPPFHLDEP